MDLFLVHGKRKMSFENYNTLTNMYSFFAINKQQERYNAIIEEMIK